MGRGFVPFAIDVVLCGGAVHLGRRWLARAEARGLGEVLAREVHHAAVIGAALAALVLVAIGLSDLRPVDPTAAIYAAWGGTTGIAICATLIAVVDLHLGWAHGSSRAALALGWIRIAVCFVAFVAVAFTWRVCVQSVFIYEIF